MRAHSSPCFSWANRWARGLACWSCIAGYLAAAPGCGLEENVGAEQEDASSEQGPIDITGAWDVVYTVETVDTDTERKVGDQWHGTWQITEDSEGELTLTGELGTMTSVEVTWSDPEGWPGELYAFQGDIPFDSEVPEEGAIYTWPLTCFAGSAPALRGTLEIGFLICFGPCPPAPADTWTFVATR